MESFMLLGWMAKLLCRPARSTRWPRPVRSRSVTFDRERQRQGAASAGEGNGHHTDGGDLLDPQRFLIFQAHEREPLHPDDAAQLAGLREQILACLERSDFPVLLFPELAQRLIRRGSHGQRQDVNTLVQLIHQDPMLSAHILLAARCETQGRLGEVRSVRDAVARLGTEGAWQIALTAAVHTVLDRETDELDQLFRDSWHQQRSHAIAVATTCGWMAMTCRTGDVERAFLAGLLHDIGKIFALHGLGQLGKEGALRKPLSPMLIEAVLEEVHVEVGRELLAHWGLPGYLVACCGAHHNDEVDAGEVELHIVRLVSGLDEIRRHPWHRPGLVDHVLDSAAALEMDALRLRATLAFLGEMTARSEHRMAESEAGD